MPTINGLEYFGVASGLLYLLLEIRQHRAMWVVGLTTSLVYVVVFFHAKIYADMGLNLYYVAISLYGLRQWSRQENGAAGSAPIRYRHLTLRLGAALFGVLAALFGAIWYILRYHTDSPIPLGDAFTTAVGIVATWMLARRILEHWPLWIVVNLVSVYLYYVRALYPTLFLYLCYATLAGYGWYTWKKKGIKTDDNRL